MSQPFDLLITNGQVASGQRVFAANIAVRAGHVAALLAPDEFPGAQQVIDAAGLHVLPGVIDTHVHLRDPGRPEREDFVSGTSAAAAGGITTIMEMPISEPPVNSAAILSERAATVQPRALVDFALYAALGQDTIGRAAELAAAGAVAFKTFLHAPVPGREHEFAGLCCTDDGALQELMRDTAATGLRHCFHCENNAMLEYLERRLRAAGRGDGMAHAESRPPFVEDASVATVLALAAESGGPVHIVHMASPLAVQMVVEARARGVNITNETCPQYLFLTYAELEAHGPFARCNPALRSPETVAALWPYVQQGHINVIGSDHSPYVPAEKERAIGDIFSSPAGMPGLEALLPCLLTAVNQGRLTLPQLVRLTSEHAAELFRLPGKGRIAPGYDADFTLVDLNEQWTFDRNRCFTKARDCMRAYHGKAMHGQIKKTIVRGTTVFDNGDIVAEPGYGRFLRPA